MGKNSGRMEEPDESRGSKVDLLNNTMVWSFASQFCKPLWIVVPRVLISFIYF